MSNNEFVNDLTEDTLTINYVDVIQTVIASLEHDKGAMVSQTEAAYVWEV